MIENARVLTVDPSSVSTGLFFNCGRSRWTDTIEIKGEFYLRCAKTEDAMIRVLEKWRPTVVLIEAIAFGGTKVAQMAAAGAAIRMACARAGVAFVDVPISSWKALSGRFPKGTVKEKSEYIEHVLNKTGIQVKNCDEADAVMIYRAVAQIVGGETRTPTQKRIKAEFLSSTGGA